MINSAGQKRMDSFVKKLLLFLLCFAFISCDQDQTVDEAPLSAEAKSTVTLIVNARIHAFDEADTSIGRGGIAFDDSGKILAVGESDPLMEEFLGARLIDLGGKTVLPGLIDSHGHLYGLAVSYTRANLVGAASKQEALDRLREFEADLPEGEWLLGRGWDQNDWPEKQFPDRADLDTLFPDRPVWLRRIDGHAAWANSVAIAQADAELAGDWQLEGGHIHRDAAGEPTGIFIDGAMKYIEDVVPATSPELIDSALDIATNTLVSLGLTGVHDPGVGRDIVRLYQRKISEGALPLRVYAMADGMNETTDWLCSAGALSDPSGRLLMRSVKLYADGALGSRGAALLADYSDGAGNRGLMFMSADEIQSALRKVFSCGLQAGVHAIGDAANRLVLDAYEQVLAEYPENPGRHRIEHAQILNVRDIPRFAGLGVIAAMQPTHATSDMYWAGERLGEERLAGAYAWQSLLDSGALLAFGSDFPVEEVNPMLGIHAAVTRQDQKGWPEGGWQAQERISRKEAIRAFTRDAAYAGFMEEEVGSLETGKRADFIVLEEDILEIPAEMIPGMRVLQTWVDGKQVFSRKSTQ
jgi:predicted amidohydrolase YtcJ